MLKESKTLEFKKEMSDTFLKTVFAFATLKQELLCLNFVVMKLLMREYSKYIYV